MVALCQGTYGDPLGVGISYERGTHVFHRGTSLEVPLFVPSSLQCGLVVQRVEELYSNVYSYTVSNNSSFWRKSHEAYAAHQSTVAVSGAWHAVVLASNSLKKYPCLTSVGCGLTVICVNHDVGRIPHNHQFNFLVESLGTYCTGVPCS